MRGSMRDVLFLLMMISVVLAAVLTIAVISPSAVEVQQIKPEELKKLIESYDPNILMVDTQPKKACDLGHIKGAINFPWATEIKNPVNLPKNKTLILYCDCGHGEDSINVADPLLGMFGSYSSEEDSIDVAEQLMSKFGYKNIKILEGGWSKWQQLGYPVDTLTSY